MPCFFLARVRFYWPAVVQAVYTEESSSRLNTVSLAVTVLFQRLFIVSMSNRHTFDHRVCKYPVQIKNMKITKTEENGFSLDDQSESLLLQLHQSCLLSSLPHRSVFSNISYTDKQLPHCFHQSFSHFVYLN